MFRSLQRIVDWERRAHAANYCVATLARDCNVSARTLERHFKRDFAVCPHEWLGRLRMRRAMELLAEGADVKEAAAELGYGFAQHFSRDFKKHFGRSPTRHFVNPRP